MELDLDWLDNISKSAVIEHTPYGIDEFVSSDSIEFRVERINVDAPASYAVDYEADLNEADSEAIVVISSDNVSRTRNYHFMHHTLKH